MTQVHIRRVSALEPHQPSPCIPVTLRSTHLIQPQCNIFCNHKTPTIVKKSNALTSIFATRDSSSPGVLSSTVRSSSLIRICERRVTDPAYRRTTSSPPPHTNLNQTIPTAPIVHLANTRPTCAWSSIDDNAASRQQITLKRGMGAVFGSVSSGKYVIEMWGGGW